MKIAEYMQAHIGETFKGIISSITSFGMYVELENTVEGLVRIVNLDDDYYVFNKDRFELVGEKRKKTYRIGQPIKVTVLDANKNAGSVDFGLPKKQSRFTPRKDARKKDSFKRRDTKRFGRKEKTSCNRKDTRSKRKQSGRKERNGR